MATLQNNSTELAQRVIIFIVVVLSLLVASVVSTAISQSRITANQVPSSATTEDAVPTSFVTEPARLGRFTSTHYNLTFDYPTTLGTAQSAYDPNGFKNEVVRFTTSPITITYWRWEGGIGNVVNQDQTTSADGKVFNIYTYQTTPGGDQFGILATGLDNNGIGSVTISAEFLPSQAESDRVKADIISITNSMSFSLNIPSFPPSTNFE